MMFSRIARLQIPVLAIADWRSSCYSRLCRWPITFRSSIAGSIALSVHIPGDGSAFGIVLALSILNHDDYLRSICHVIFLSALCTLALSFWPYIFPKKSRPTVQPAADRVAYVQVLGGVIVLPADAALHGHQLRGLQVKVMPTAWTPFKSNETGE